MRRSENHADLRLALLVVGLCVLRLWQFAWQGYIEEMGYTDQYVDMARLVDLANYQMIGSGLALLLGGAGMMEYFKLVPNLGKHFVAIKNTIFALEVRSFAFFFFCTTFILAISMLAAFGGGVEAYRSIEAASFSGFQGKLLHQKSQKLNSL